MTGTIRTVLGDIAPPAGPMLIHEHLQIDLSHNKGPETVLGPGDIDDIIHDLVAARRDHGLRVMTDLSVPGSGRDLQALRRISSESGVAVVAAAGFYWDPVHPDAISGSVDQLRKTMVRDIETGEDGVRCGVIKIGTDKGDTSEPTARIFQAAALASNDTGAAIITHTSTPDQAQWQIDQLERAGANLSRVLISHLHNFGAVESIAPHARRGVRFGYDQIGFAKGPTYDDYADLVARTDAAGLLGQLLVSTDVARRARLSRHGGTSYSTLFTHFLPALRARDVSDAQIAQLIEDNPRALLAMAA
jgi:phosphotriesterase-related protein